MYFTREDSSSSENQGGHTFASSRSIWIDAVDSNGQSYPPYHIAFTIIHEWEHVRWKKENWPHPELLRSTPNERNAYLATASYMQQYLDKLISKHLPEIEEYQRLIKESPPSEATTARIAELSGLIRDVFSIAQTIHVDRVRNVSSNVILHYPFSDITSRSDLPAHSEDLDLDVYPIDSEKTLLVHWVGDDDAPLKDILKVARFYRRIMDGKNRFFGEISISPDGKIEQSAVVIQGNDIKILKQENDAFPNLIPIQRTVGIPLTGRLGKDHHYHSLYLSTHPVYQNNETQIHDMIQYMNERLRALPHEQQGKIAVALRFAIFSNSAKENGLHSILPPLSSKLSNLSQRGFTSDDIDITVEILRKLVDVSDQIAKSSNVTSLDISHLIWRKMTNYWEINNHVINALLSLSHNNSVVRILKDAGYPTGE